MIIVEVAALLLLTVAMAVSLAHALEFPGRRRLDRATYVAVQTASYAGAAVSSLAEAAAVFAVLALLVSTPIGSPAFWWVSASMAGLFGMNVSYWLMARPANKVWLNPQALNRATAAEREAGGPWGRAPAGFDFRRLRDRWEWSHVVRAGLALLSLASLTAAVALGPTH
ncbi:MAG TPA: hypothetical protein VKT30_13555 [Caulobacteraceae bacterium]|nr:hypothetical protein [Caulobacteraceae bacterium]